MSQQYAVPSTRVISPSPTPSEAGTKDDYFPPTARSKAQRKSSVEPIAEHAADSEPGAPEDVDPELMRARSRSRSPNIGRNGLQMTTTGGVTTGSKVSGLPPKPAAKVKRRPEEVVTSNASLKEPEQEKLTGFLSPASAYTRGFGSAYWRNLSRSPSPFGLIPIHREWRAFVHKHEIPRKVLHVSIGFVTLWLYREGAQTVQIHPILLGLLIPIFTVDFVRFRWPEFNRVYIRFLGAFMRESEAHDRYNGVIGYLAGIWVTMYLSKKDVAVMSVLLLSWCDTAASTFGRLWGKYTPRIRRGKSLAGSIAAFAFGVGASVLFWGFIAPQTPEEYNTGINSFAYQGVLTLPAQARGYLGWTEAQSSISGKGALGVVSVVSGLVASVSEALDVYGFDDNLTIPILCGAGLGAFLWAFGGT